MKVIVNLKSQLNKFIHNRYAVKYPIEIIMQFEKLWAKMVNNRLFVFIKTQAHQMPKTKLKISCK